MKFLLNTNKERQFTAKTKHYKLETKQKKLLYDPNLESDTDTMFFSILQKSTLPGVMQHQAPTMKTEWTCPYTKEHERHKHHLIPPA